MDAWFAGFQPTLAAVVWIGYDTPRKLGDHESGGGLSLPVWIDFMAKALKNVPITMPTVPGNIQNVDGKWLYDEYTAGAGITTLDQDSVTGDEKKGVLPPSVHEKRQILELFKTD